MDARSLISFEYCNEFADEMVCCCHLQLRFPNFLLGGPFFANLLLRGPQLYVTLLLLPDSLPIIIIKIRIEKKIELFSKKEVQHLYYYRNLYFLVTFAALVFTSLCHCRHSRLPLELRIHRAAPVVIGTKTLRLMFCY